MALERKQQPPHKTTRRIWQTPVSPWNWLCLAGALTLVGFSAALTCLADATLSPILSRMLGALALVLFLVSACYSIRRRVVRQLPGRVQDWLWLHIWTALAGLGLVLLHANWQSLREAFSALSSADLGRPALAAVLFLILSGLLGRGLDRWQARVIASEADTNGAGIARAVEERLLELSLALERISAGRSAPFKRYCHAALQSPLAGESEPVLQSAEREDFQRAQAILSNYWRLQHSLQRQRRALQIIRLWRRVHTPLAMLALLLILYHVLFEIGHHF